MMPGSIVAIILTVFYLYLAVRSERIKRPVLFWIGALALSAAMVMECFFLIDSTAVKVVFSILMLVLLAISFLVGLASAFGGRLPVQIAGTETTQTE